MFTRDLPPHQIYRFPEEEEDSDCDDIYVPYSGMNINDLAAEEMGYTDLNSGEGGDVANGVDSSDVAIPAEEVREYQNLWSSEDDPRAIPAPAVICPVHRLGCKRGICEDMAKILGDMKKRELRAN